MNVQCARDSSLVHVGTLMALSAALFLPIIGRGYVHDDFVWIYDAAYQSRWYGLTHAAGGPFYSPVTWLTFKMDWLLFGAPAFLLAVENLAVHIANILLLYALALQLWRSKRAAWWTALGFSLLFPANTWAAMWISTRAHVLATFFYLTALNATLRLQRGRRLRPVYALAVIAFAASAIFSKETGVTVVASIAILAFYERRSHHRRITSASNIVLFAVVLAVLGGYFWLRARSGAVAILSEYAGYRYRAEPYIFIENLWRYSWRTFGLLGILAACVFASARVWNVDRRLLGPIARRVLLCVVLFAISIAPVVLLDERSGIYTYLPGCAAALAFGTVTLATTRPRPMRASRAWLRSTPIALVVLIYCVFSFVHCIKWLRMAETNTAVLEQIKAQRPKAEPDSFFLLIYSNEDPQHRFPEGLSRYGLRYALRLAYADPSIDGVVMKEDEASHRRVRRKKTNEFHFNYVENSDPPRVIEVMRN